MTAILFGELLAGGLLFTAYSLYAKTSCMLACRSRRVVEGQSGPDSKMATGRVRTHAVSMLRIVDHWRPEPLAAIVPATPDGYFLFSHLF